MLIEPRRLSGLRIRKILRLAVCERAMSHHQLGINVAANRDLDAFDGLHDYHPQSAVEIVCAPDGFEVRSGLEVLFVVLEVVPVSAKAVVANRLETANQPGAISDQASADD